MEPPDGLATLRVAVPNSYKAKGVLASTSLTTLHTATTGVGTIVLAWQIANISTATQTVGAAWTDASAGSTFWLLKNASVPKGQSVSVPGSQRLVLEASDVAKVIVASTADVAHATLAYLEVS